MGETRVVERAAARGDGESPKLGPAGGREYERWSSGPGFEKKLTEAKERAGRWEITVGGD